MQTKSITFRVPGDTAEAAEIMSSVLGQTVTQYVLEALIARLSVDVPDNIQAYEAVRRTRQKAQEKGA